MEDFVITEGGFSVHARYSDGDGDPEYTPKYDAWIYLGVEVVFTWDARADEFPAGIEDFAGIALRRFAQRLRYVLMGE